MDKKFNFKIESNFPCSQLSENIGINNFSSLCNYVKNLPYGRTNNRSDYKAVVVENKGTCSTKHAFLKAIAIENNQQTVKLFIGIYKMSETNTAGVGKVLIGNNLEYIPEAHTYLKVNDSILDITRNEISENSFEKDLLTEVEIIPEQIGEYKLKLHQQFLKNWLEANNSNLSFDELWNIREACILALSNKKT